ncbi:hypothetical protein B0H11DRAFT_2209006 [Mycena galericulata]|nr:hypothetical protein B0H11DRAFT_2209006 [Mycena galericulata]
MGVNRVRSESAADVGPALPNTCKKRCEAVGPFEITKSVKGRPLSVFYPDGPFPAPTPSAHRKSISSRHGRGVGVRELCNHLLTPCSRYVMYYVSPCLQSTYPTVSGPHGCLVGFFRSVTLSR